MLKIETFSTPPLDSNCYIITDVQTGLSAVLDPGYPGGEGFEKAVALGDKLKYVLLTHRHFDHVLGAAAIKRLTGAKIAVHELDACGISDTAASMYDTFAAYYDVVQEPAEADILLSEGDKVRLGESVLSVMHTPGHTIGSVCFMCGNDVFTGDTLFRGSMGRVDFETGSVKQMAASLKRLAGLDEGVRVYPGHDALTEIGHEKMYNDYMKQAENGTLYY